MNTSAIKQRFGVIGNCPALDRALFVAAQVAPTDLSVLILGESGTGKETMPKIVHQFSSRKHGKYIAVNCGAIPEGTIDSELFGHVKGAFTGATESRNGYFEEADGGTIFLDEVAELPMTTQVRLLRVLESGEFMKVGSSKTQKTDVRVVAATNVDFEDAFSKGKFREDLYYRLNQVPINMPPLRKRAGDIHLLFRKFTTDFSEMHRMPPLSLSPDAVDILESYPWPGNIRQLKHITEQMSVLEAERKIDSDTILSYLPETHRSRLPVRITTGRDGFEKGEPGANEKEMLYKVLFDMKGELDDLKRVVLDIIKSGGQISQANKDAVQRAFTDEEISNMPVRFNNSNGPMVHDVVELETTSLSLIDSERELIIKALSMHKNKRKLAAAELGISERTLYRKIKEYDLK
ncbi:MAG: sigma-54-dependent Fis family transcriptional regulator [Crocinitomicaceae bacterium]|nr:sigma-54-dependent Fis family transcriptional regulator [Crocinitomicaceae bacterium]|tara:strand:- start:387 stop:1604 length:1218 start_codon:yes stop_codon:yes gene_type:complete